MLCYDGRKIIPAPIVTVAKTYARSEGGPKIGATYDLTLAGTILPFKGSPSGHYPSVSGAFWTLHDYPPDEPFQGNNEDFNSILRKQEALRWLFSRDGRSLEWQPSNGQPVVKCNPRIIDLSFAEGNWAEKCEYTVRCQADWLYLNGQVVREDDFATDLLSSANESWSFEEKEGWGGQGLNVSHEVTAQGIEGYDAAGQLYNSKECWQHARDWCVLRATGTVPEWIVTNAIGGSWVGGAYGKTIKFDRNTGSYGIVENWTLSSSPTFIQKSFSSDYMLEVDEYRVRYEGVVHPIADRIGSSSALAVARGAIPSTSAARIEAMTALAGQLGSKILCSSPESRSVVLNQSEGTATFTYEWTTSLNPDYAITYDATLSFSNETHLYSLSMTATIQGKGVNARERLEHAKLAVPSDAAAYSKAIGLFSALPPGFVIRSSSRSRSFTTNEQAGRISVSWAWDSNDEHSLDISVSIQNPGRVAAILQIPGRSAGPIIQDMNTYTEKTVTVTLRGKEYARQPDSAAMLASCAAQLPALAGTKLLVADTETWNPKTRTYERSVRYLVKGE